MLDGPRPRFPSSIAIASPEDARHAVADLTARGADFIKLQSLLPRDAVLAIAEEARKREIAFAGHVPNAMRASDMSEAGMKSFEHLIGIFEGSSTAEDAFLEGGKTEVRFLAPYDEARAASLALCETSVAALGASLLRTVPHGSDEVLVSGIFFSDSL